MKDELNAEIMQIDKLLSLVIMRFGGAGVVCFWNRQDVKLGKMNAGQSVCPAESLNPYIEEDK